MRNAFRRQLGNERGAVAVIVAVCMVALVGLLALAIDGGMLLDTRTESQRASDTAALAAAAEFFTGETAPDSLAVVATAVDYAGRNTMRGTAVAPSDVANVEILYDSAKVRVTLRRPAVPTWFAAIFGITAARVGSRSAARIVPSGSGNCMAPFAVPDTAYDPNSWGDRRLVVDSRDPGYVLVGWGEGPPGGGNFQNDIRYKCNDRTARLSLANPWVWAKPSGVLPPGQIRNPFNDLYNSDPGLFYNEADDKFYRTVDGVPVEEPNWRESARVRNVAILDHTTIQAINGAYQVKMVDIVAIFFEGPPQQCPPGSNAYCNSASDTWVWGRFFPAIGMADDCGTPAFPCAPSLSRLRLIE